MATGYNCVVQTKDGLVLRSWPVGFYLGDLEAPLLRLLLLSPVAGLVAEKQFVQ